MSPELTVVVASFSRRGIVDRCLDALADQLADGDQVVIARPADLETPTMPSGLTVELMEAEPGSDIFRLRRLGAEQARGRLVALIEDHVFPTPGWADALRRAYGEGRRVIGGPVAPAPGVDFALYACEYGWHAPPGKAGAVAALSGVNVAYDRRLLAELAPLWREELREDELDDALKHRGEELIFVPEAVVESALEMSRTAAVAHLFAGGRHFGRRRASAASIGRRLLSAAGSPLVPAVLGLRLYRRLAAWQDDGRGRVFRHLVGIALLLTAWSAGEALGTLAALFAGPVAAEPEPVADTLPAEEEPPPCA